MGILKLSLVEERSKMKFFVAACLVAALLYGAYGYAGYSGYPYAVGYSGYAGYPYTYGAYAYAGYPYAGLRTYGAYPYAAAYGAYPYTYGAYGHYLGKRSADAEPEADAALLYGAYGYAGY